MDLPLKDEKELNIALNNLTGEWEYDALKNLLADLKPGVESRQLLGFSEQEFTALLKWGEEAEVNAGVGLTPAERLETFQSNTIKQVVIYLADADYGRVLKRFVEIAAKQKLESHSDVVLFLLNQYDESHPR